MPDRVLHALKGMNIRRDMPLSELTSFRIGGPAALVLRPKNAEEISRAIQACSQYSLPYCVLGNGTNILAPDAGYRGLVIRLDTPLTTPLFIDSRVTCPAATSLSVLAREAVAYGLMGLESLSGIPGTVGGACAMNAGAYGAEIRHVLKSVRILQNGRVLDVTVKRGDFGNRTSRFAAPEAIVLAATFQLSPDDGGARERMLDYTRQRKAKQPLSFPSAGSVFKRPKGRFAGALIESCGLKGVSVGGAQVSPLHAGFIVNNGRATERDVLALIRLIQQRVLEETGVQLEREVRLLSEVSVPCTC
ncbi:MAG: UDP-N-acetylmuramate dehydrogenase [Clostridia bacterium]|nr:UDP-N-acetylmuramate dehydrogenase [Clostridia bacterium]